MEIRKFFGLPEKRSEALVTQPDESAYYGTGSLLFGKLFNSGGAMNIAAAFRCVELISDGVASLPIFVKKKNSKGVTNIVKSHAVNLLFSDKTSRISKFQLMKLLAQSVMLRGNGYAYIERAADGTPVKLRFLEANDVQLTYDKAKDILFYQCSYINHGARIEPKNMLHFVKNSYDGIKGVSVVTYAKRTLDISNASENQAQNFFSNGCNLSGILKVNSTLSAKQREQILSSWNSAYTQGGSGLAVLQGNMDYQSISLSSKDAQALETREYNVSDVARFFGVHPALLGLKGYNSYSSLEDVQQDFLVHTLMPYIIMFETEFDRKLLNVQEDNLKIILDTNGFLRSTKATQAQYYTGLLNSGVLTVNEVRRDLGYNAVDGGDVNRIAYSDANQNAISNNNGEGNKEPEQ